MLSSKWAFIFRHFWSNYQLFNDKTPRTADQFVNLCKGTLKGPQGNKLSIKDIKFDQIIPSLYALGGNLSGTGWFSVIDTHIFIGFFNENFQLSHNKEGLLSLVNTDNSTKFLITLGDVSW